MQAFKILVAFLFGCLYASAAWSLTLPCDSCLWHVAPILILVLGSFLIAGFLIVTLADAYLTNPAGEV